MSDRVRDIVLGAYAAARSGYRPDTAVERAIAEGSRSLSLEDLDFDSLAWMEFCISVELECGQELTPRHIEKMRRVSEIEDWLRARMPL